MISRTERILERLPRATPGTEGMPKVGLNAVLVIDAAGQLHILTEYGILTLPEEDLGRLRCSGYLA